MNTACRLFNQMYALTNPNSLGPQISDNTFFYLMHIKITMNINSMGVRISEVLDKRVQISEGPSAVQLVRVNSSHLDMVYFSLVHNSLGPTPVNISERFKLCISNGGTTYFF